MLTGPAGILDFDCGLDGAWSDGFWAPQNSPFHSSLLSASGEDNVGSAHFDYLHILLHCGCF